MVDKNYCNICGIEVNSLNKDLCKDCQDKSNLALILKKLLKILDGRIQFNEKDFKEIGIYEWEFNEILLKLLELNLVKVNNQSLSIKNIDLLNKFIDKYRIDSNLDVYNSETFVLNKNNDSYKQDILNIANNIDFIEEDPSNLNRFIFICQHLMEKDLSKKEFKEINQVHDRIVYMYMGMGLYFKIFEKYKSDDQIFVKLNIKGKAIFELDEYYRNIGICHCILEHKIFHEVFMDCFNKQDINIDSIVEIMHNYDLNLNSEVTIRRRAQCVSSWMHWMFKLMDL